MKKIFKTLAIASAILQLSKVDLQALKRGEEIILKKPAVSVMLWAGPQKDKLIIKPLPQIK